METDWTKIHLCARVKLGKKEGIIYGFSGGLIPELSTPEIWIRYKKGKRTVIEQVEQADFHKLEFLD